MDICIGLKDSNICSFCDIKIEEPLCTPEDWSDCQYNPENNTPSDEKAQIIRSRRSYSEWQSLFQAIRDCENPPGYETCFAIMEKVWILNDKRHRYSSMKGSYYYRESLYQFIIDMRSIGFGGDK